MKLVLMTMASTSEKWSDLANNLYFKKIGYFHKIERAELKGTKASRSESELRQQSDTQIFLDKLTSDDFVVVLDERGVGLKSKDFAKKLESAINSGKKRVVFCIGGPYGFSDAMRARANLTVSFGPQTMNHLLAEVVLLEQIYRGLTIIKGLPYHNE
jgi:23S rRNA (pseudouridine1915-N3)-methyltransferase